jgi:hypothetical protein
MELGLDLPAGKYVKTKSSNVPRSYETSVVKCVDDISKYFEVIPDVYRRFKCLLCKNEFSGTFSNFRSHIWSIHTVVAKASGVKPVTVNKRKRDIMSDSDDDDSTSYDEIAENNERYFEKLRSDKRQFRCLLCNNEYSGSLSNFHIHMRSMHREEVAQKKDQQNTETEDYEDDNSMQPLDSASVADSQANTSQSSQNFSIENGSEYFESIPGPNRQFKCLMCNFNYTGNFGNFRAHMWAMHKSDAIALGVKQTTVIVKSKRSNESGYKFFESLYGDIPKFRCRICKNTYRGTFGNFRGHMWSMHKATAKAHEIAPLPVVVKQKLNNLSSDDEDDFVDLSIKTC